MISLYSPETFLAWHLMTLMELYFFLSCSIIRSNSASGSSLMLDGGEYISGCGTSRSFRKYELWLVWIAVGDCECSPSGPLANGDSSCDSCGAIEMLSWIGIRTLGSSSSDEVSSNAEPGSSLMFRRTRFGAT